MRELVQELVELGPRGTLFRLGWELRTRTGLAFLRRAAVPPLSPHAAQTWPAALPFADPVTVARVMAPRIPESALERLRADALEAAAGRITCFGSWKADYGDPIDWHLNPVSGKRWDPAAPWTHALAAEGEVGDVKLTWEVARFPHFYAMARAAAFFPELAENMAAAVAAQIGSFLRENPAGRGVHWNSGQEIAFRLMAWLFAQDVLLERSSWRERTRTLIAEALGQAAAHVEQHIDYARHAVYNNHLLSEALLLYMAGTLLPVSRSARWRSIGQALLHEGVERQFYADGGYIQQSHNYHRVALQDLAWAWLFARSAGERPPARWLSAMERSIDLLVAHQNPADGRLPNYGSNDGALPSIFTTCDFSDFRPTLQLASLISRGERLYPPGPWDESAAWALGAGALEAPLRPPRRISVSFGTTGYHVLRGRDPGSFATLRCGSLRDRFSQIDMLHLDVFWRGQNVLVDGGSYLYNGPAAWHEHFLRTASHNTLTVDGRDQMLHHRRFKVLYPTRARLLRFEDLGDHLLAAGEHYGYARHPGGCVHRRSVLFFPDDLWVVFDHVRGEGEHHLRLHWLCGDFPWRADPENGMVELQTPEGELTVAVHDEHAVPLPATVVAGSEDPPRGWLSRHYGRKVPVPSLAVERTVTLPATFVTVIGRGRPALERQPDGALVIRRGETVHSLVLEDGLPHVHPARGS